MHKRYAAVLMLGLFLINPAWAQDQEPRGKGTENTPRTPPAQGSSAGPDAIRTIRRNNASRLSPSEEEGLTLTLKNEITTHTTVPAIQLKSCQARVSLSYYQRNTQVRVETKIHHDGCQASAGKVDILLSYRNENDETESAVFTEEWQRNNEENLEFTRDYPVGEQASLSQVLARNVRCTCSDPVPAE